MQLFAFGLGGTFAVNQSAFCAPHGDQNLIRFRPYSPAWQGVAQNEFDQLWIIPIEVITGQSIIIFRAQSLKCTEPPIRPIKQGFIGLAVDEGIFVTAPNRRVS